MQTLEEYCGKYKEEGEEFKTLINGVLPDGWADELPTFTEKDKPLATRLHSQTMLNALAPVLPGFWGGSAGQSAVLVLVFVPYVCTLQTKTLHVFFPAIPTPACSPAWTPIAICMSHSATLGCFWVQRLQL